jgi:hypothetical protein
MQGVKQPRNASDKDVIRQPLSYQVLLYNSTHSPYQGAFLLPMKKRIYTYDTYAGSNIELERKKHHTPTMQRNERVDGLRFCECCRQRKPVNSRPHVKGWKCTDCIKQSKEAA